MIMKIKEAENRIFREWVKGENLCSNSTKKETDIHVVPATRNAGSYALSTLHDNARHEFVSLSAHNVSNKDNIVKSDTMQRYAKKCKGDFNGYLEL